MNASGKSSVRIRPMVYSDIDPVLRLWWSSFIANKDMVASQLKGPLDSSFIAEVEGHLVGFILARIQYVGIPVRGICAIYAVAGHPEYRRQGIGSQLVSKLKSHCGNKGIITMRAVVSQDDSQLLNYFERLGFHRSNMVNLELRCEGEA